MATAKTKPAAAAKKAEPVDDLLAGKKPAAKKAKPAAAAEPVDDLLAGKKPAAKKAKKAPSARASSDSEAVRAALLKVRKLTSYADFAAAGDFDIRSVRRTARAMRDEGLIALVKEGTTVFIKKV